MQIEATLAEGAEEELADAINAKTDQTGVSAEFDPKTRKITLVEESSSTIMVQNIHIEGQYIANKDTDYHMKFSTIDEYGKQIGGTRILTDEDQLLGSGIENLVSFNRPFIYPTGGNRRADDKGRHSSGCHSISEN